MREAIKLSLDNIDHDGGPFGAVIVKDGKIIARGANRVTASVDPTAHAEVNAIREAARVLGTFDLSGCEIYTSCEPCPMCLGAIYWAHLDKVYYGNTKADAKEIGFDDSFIYDELALPLEKRHLNVVPMIRGEAIKMLENGMQKKVTEPYLVDALSFTEAEARIIEEVSPFISGEFSVSAVKRANFSELFFDETGDRWYKCKLNFITLDEKSGMEKRTASYMLVQAADFETALKNLVEGMKGTMADWVIVSITETPLMDVYPFDPERKTKEEDRPQE